MLPKNILVFFDSIFFKFVQIEPVFIEHICVVFWHIFVYHVHTFSVNSCLVFTVKSNDKVNLLYCYQPFIVVNNKFFIYILFPIVQYKFFFHCVPLFLNRLALLLPCVY